MYDERIWDLYGDNIIEGMRVLRMIAIVVLFIMIINTVAMAFIFKKARRSMWYAIVPYCNTFEMYDIAWGSGIAYTVLTILICAPMLSTKVYTGEGNGIISTIISTASLFLVVSFVIAQYKLAQSFGYDVLFTIGLILFRPIFLCILAFGKAMYMGPGGKYAEIIKAGFCPPELYPELYPEGCVSFDPEHKYNIGGPMIRLSDVNAMQKQFSSKELEIFPYSDI